MRLGGLPLRMALVLFSAKVGIPERPCATQIPAYCRRTGFTTWEIRQGIGLLKSQHHVSGLEAVEGEDQWAQHRVLLCTLDKNQLVLDI